MPNKPIKIVVSRLNRNQPIIVYFFIVHNWRKKAFNTSRQFFLFADKIIDRSIIPTNTPELAVNSFVLGWLMIQKRRRCLFLCPSWSQRPSHCPHHTG